MKHSMRLQPRAGGVKQLEYAAVGHYSREGARWHGVRCCDETYKVNEAVRCARARSVLCEWPSVVSLLTVLEQTLCFAILSDSYKLITSHPSRQCTQQSRFAVDQVKSTLRKSTLCYFIQGESALMQRLCCFEKTATAWLVCSMKLGVAWACCNPCCEHWSGLQNGI